MAASDASTSSDQNPVQTARKVVGEAFTAAWAGQPLSTEISFQEPTTWCRWEGNMTEGAIAMSSKVLAVSQTLSMPRSFTRENREILEAPDGFGLSGRAVEGHPRTTAMHASRKSDEGVVPLIRRRPTGRGTGEGRPEP